MLKIFCNILHFLNIKVLSRVCQVSKATHFVRLRHISMLDKFDKEYEFLNNGRSWNEKKIITVEPIFSNNCCYNNRFTNPRFFSFIWVKQFISTITSIKNGFPLL